MFNLETQRHYATWLQDMNLDVPIPRNGEATTEKRLLRRVCILIQLSSSHACVKKNTVPNSSIEDDGAEK